MTKDQYSGKVLRHFLIKCRTNRGGRHLAPETVQEIAPGAPGDLMGYAPVGEHSKYFGDLHAPLTARGDLVTLADGFTKRITRHPRVGKSVRPGRNGKTFVQVSANVPEWQQFTKRTNEPKLSWLLNECRAAGLRVVRHGRSWHAPITLVHRDDSAAAWKILSPVDDVPDDDPRWSD